MIDLFSLLIVYIVFLGAMMSPGPDFLIVLRNALGYSVRAGVLTSAGIAVALIIHLAYSIAGIGVLISQSILFFNLVKWLGAAYLVYLGVQALKSKGTDTEAMKVKTIEAALSGKNMSDKKAFMSGFLTNLLNPKAALFFVALFSQMVGPNASIEFMLLFAVLCVASAFIWFSSVSCAMGIASVRRGYARSTKWIDRVFGAFFIALGVKLALAKV